MARNVVKRDATAVAKTDDIPADKAPILGGAPGMLEDPNPRSNVIHGVGNVVPAREELRRAEVPPRIFKVTNPAPVRVVYAGQPITVHPGREYLENAVDLALLRRQGVTFEETQPKAKSTTPFYDDSPPPPAPAAADEETQAATA